MVTVLTAVLLVETEICGWMTASRIWSPDMSCELSSKFDPRVVIRENTTDQNYVDLSVINVIDLEKFQEDTDQCVYHAIQVTSEGGQTGEIVDATFIVNVSLNLSDAICSVAYVSILSEVGGKLSNITVTGFVNITVPTGVEMKVYMSPMIGSYSESLTIDGVDVPFTDRFTELKSGIVYKIGETEYTTLESGPISSESSPTGLYRSFRDGTQTHDPWESGTYNTSTYSITTLQTEKKAYRTELSMVNRSGTQNRVHLYSAFDATELKPSSWFDYNNIFRNYYVDSWNIFLERYHSSRNMYPIYFNGNESSDSSNYDTVVYYSDTFSIAYSKGSANQSDHTSQEIYCDNGTIYYVANHTCVTLSQCRSARKYVYKSLCLEKCLDGHRISGGAGDERQTCYSECPLFLGQTNGDDGTSCRECSSNNQLAYINDENGKGECQQGDKCPTGLFRYRQGCYSYCPEGTFKESESSKVCKEVNSSSKCPQEAPYLVKASEFDKDQYFDRCEPSCPDGMYLQLGQDKECRPYCDGVLFGNLSCSVTRDPDTVQCTESRIKDELTSMKGNNSITFYKCRSMCNMGKVSNNVHQYVEVYGRCNSQDANGTYQCEQGMYGNAAFRTCQPCSSHPYDERKPYWIREMEQCAASCDSSQGYYYNLSVSDKYGKFCEKIGEYCRILEEQDVDGQKQRVCKSQCGVGKFMKPSENETSEDEKGLMTCVDTCGGNYPFVSSDGKMCQKDCPSKYFNETGEGDKAIKYCLTEALCGLPYNRENADINGTNYTKCSRCGAKKYVKFDQSGCVESCTYINVNGDVCYDVDGGRNEAGCPRYQKIENATSTETQYMCAMECPSRYHLNGLCTDSCKSVRAFATNTNSYDCVEQCNSTYFTAQRSGDYACVDSCTSNQVSFKPFVNDTNYTEPAKSHTQCASSCQIFPEHRYQVFATNTCVQESECRYQRTQGRTTYCETPGSDNPRCPFVGNERQVNDSSNNSVKVYTCRTACASGVVAALDDNSTNFAICQDDCWAADAEPPKFLVQIPGKNMSQCSNDCNTTHYSYTPRGLQCLAAHDGLACGNDSQWMNNNNTSYTRCETTCANFSESKYLSRNDTDSRNYCVKDCPDYVDPRNMSCGKSCNGLKYYVTENGTKMCQGYCAMPSNGSGPDPVECQKCNDDQVPYLSGQNTFDCRTCGGKDYMIISQGVCVAKTNPDKYSCRDATVSLCKATMGLGDDNPNSSNCPFYNDIYNYTDGSSNVCAKTCPDNISFVNVTINETDGREHRQCTNTCDSGTYNKRQEEDMPEEKVCGDCGDNIPSNKTGPPRECTECNTSGSYVHEGPVCSETSCKDSNEIFYKYEELSSDNRRVVCQPNCIVSNTSNTPGFVTSEDDLYCFDTCCDESNELCGYTKFNANNTDGTVSKEAKICHEDSCPQDYYYNMSKEEGNLTGDEKGVYECVSCDNPLFIRDAFCVTRCKNNMSTITGNKQRCELCTTGFINITKEGDADPHLQCVPNCNETYSASGNYNATDGNNYTQCYNLANESEIEKNSGCRYFYETNSGNGQALYFNCYESCTDVGLEFGYFEENYTVNNKTYYGKHCLSSCHKSENKYVNITEDNKMQCMSNCPDDYFKYDDNVREISYCSKECRMLDTNGQPKISFWGIDKNNTKYCDEKCTNDEQYINVKYADPSSDVVQTNSSFECVNSCTGDFKYKNDTRLHGKLQCYDKCPTLSYNGTNNECVVACTGYYVVENGSQKCVDECSNDSFIMDRECVTECSEDMPYYTNESRNCYLSCPAGYANPYCTEQSASECKKKNNTQCVKLNETTFYITDSKNRRWLLPSSVSSSCSQVKNATISDVFYELTNISNGSVNDYIFQFDASKLNGSDKLTVGQQCYRSCQPNQYQDGGTEGKLVYYCHACRGYAQLDTEKGHYQCLENCPGKQDGTYNYYKIEDGLKVCQSENDCTRYIVEGEDAAQCYDSCREAGNSNRTTPVNGTIFTLEDGKRCVVRCPDDKPFVDPGSYTCKTDCSSGSYSVEGLRRQCTTGCNGTFVNRVYDYSIRTHKECVARCPQNMSFQLPDGSCESACPDGMLISIDSENNVKRCIEECASEIQYFRNDSEGPIRVDQCDSTVDGPYTVISNTSCDRTFECKTTCTGGEYIYWISQGVCGRKCPDGYSYQGYKCTRKCDAEYKYIQLEPIISDNDHDENSTRVVCARTCQNGSQYSGSHDSFMCENCQRYKMKNGERICVKDCSINEFNQSGECVDMCDSRIVDGNTCVDSCSGNYETLEKGGVKYMSCLESCANSSKNRFQESQGERNCVEFCKDDDYHTLLPGSEGQYYCTDSCEPYAYDKNSKRCFDDCFYMLDEKGNKVCMPGHSSCITENGELWSEVRWYNGSVQCVQYCDKDSEFRFFNNYVCRSTCDTEFYRVVDHNGETQYECSGKPTGTEASTVDRSIDSTLRRIGNCSQINSGVSNMIYQFGDVCVEKCPGQYRIDKDGRCVERCSSFAFKEEQDQNSGEIVWKCVSDNDDECPYFDQIINLERRCQDSCSIYFFINGTEQKKCFSSCSLEHYRQEEGKCHCDNSTRCKYEPNDCPGGIVDLETATCQKDDTYCKYVYGDSNSKKCVEKCPAYYRYDDDKNNYQCVTECNNDEFALGKECRKSCDGYYQNNTSRTCVSECPFVNNTRFIDARGDKPECLEINNNCSFYTAVTVDGNTTYTCVESCPIQPIQGEGLNCAAACGSRPVDITTDDATVNRTCVGECPAERKFLDGRTCTNNCPYGIYFVKYDNSSHPLSDTYLNNTCLITTSQCEGGFYTEIGQETICETTCSHSDSTDDNVKRVRISDVQCGSKCPDSYVVQSQYLNDSKDLNTSCKDHGCNYCIKECSGGLVALNKKEYDVTRCQPSDVCINYNFSDDSTGGFISTSGNECKELCDGSGVGGKEVYINHDTKQCMSEIGTRYHYLFNLSNGTERNALSSDERYKRYVNNSNNYSAVYIGVAKCSNYNSMYETYQGVGNGQFRCVENCPDGMLQKEEADGYLCISRGECGNIVYEGKCLTSCPDGTLRQDRGKEVTCIEISECKGSYKADFTLGSCVEITLESNQMTIGIAAGAVVVILALVVTIVVMMVLKQKKKDRRRKNRKNQRRDKGQTGYYVGKLDQNVRGGARRQDPRSAVLGGRRVVDAPTNAAPQYGGAARGARPVRDTRASRASRLGGSSTGKSSD